MLLEILTEKNFEYWDNFVASSPYGHYMQSHAWGLLQESQGWRTHYLTLKEEELCGVALLLSRHIPLLGGRLFYAPRGPVVNFNIRKTANQFVELLSDYIQCNNGIFLRCDPYASNSEILDGKAPFSPMSQVPRDWSYWNAPKLVMWLNLQGDEDTVFKRMTSRCRNDIRRGYSNGVEFRLGGDADHQDFYRLMVETGQHKGLAFHDLSYYQKLFATMKRSTRVQLFLGRYQGEVITTGVSIIYGKTAWLLYAASTTASYKLRANRTLQWEMIKWAHSQGCERYDFRGSATSDPPSQEDPGYGVYTFKKSFGSEYTRLVGYYDLVNRPLLYRMFRTTEEKLLPAAYRVRTWLHK